MFQLYFVEKLHLVPLCQLLETQKRTPLNSACGFSSASSMLRRWSSDLKQLVSLKNLVRGMSNNKHPTFECADRIKDHSQSIWVEFTGLALACGAVNIGQGFPDFPPPEYIRKALADAAAGPNYMLNQYTRSGGHPRLVNALGRLYSKLLNHEVDPMNEILITVGAYQALFFSVFGFINPGDEAIIIEPFYDCYEPQVRMAGGVPVFVSMRLDPPTGRLATSADLKLDFDELDRAFTPRTKLLFLNNPNNPAGKVFTMEEMEKLAALAKKHNVIVVSDEVYEWVVYEGGQKMIRFASLPGMWERTITIGSAGKMFSITGWKTGWAIGPSYLLKHLHAIHQNCGYTCPTLSQEAIAVGVELETSRLGTSESYFSELSKLLLPKRDKMVEFLAAVGIKPIVPSGGYFMLADFSALSGPFDKKSVGYEDEHKDYRFVRWLCKEKKLAGIPTTAFYSTPHKKLAENYVRFCFFKKDETLAEAEKIIRKWVSSSK